MLYIYNVLLILCVSVKMCFKCVPHVFKCGLMLVCVLCFLIGFNVCVFLMCVVV